MEWWWWCPHLAVARLAARVHRLQLRVVFQAWLVVLFWARCPVTFLVVMRRIMGNCFPHLTPRGKENAALMPRRSPSPRSAPPSHSAPLPLPEWVTVSGEGLVAVGVLQDTNSLYRAAAKYVYADEERFDELLRRAEEYLEANWERFRGDALYEDGDPVSSAAEYFLLRRELLPERGRYVELWVLSAVLDQAIVLHLHGRECLQRAMRFAPPSQPAAGPRGCRRGRAHGVRGREQGADLHLLQNTGRYDLLQPGTPEQLHVPDGRHQVHHREPTKPSTELNVSDHNDRELTSEKLHVPDDRHQVEHREPTTEELHVSNEHHQVHHRELTTEKLHVPDDRHQEDHRESTTDELHVSDGCHQVHHRELTTEKLHVPDDRHQVDHRESTTEELHVPDDRHQVDHREPTAEQSLHGHERRPYVHQREATEQPGRQDGLQQLESIGLEAAETAQSNAFELLGVGANDQSLRAKTSADGMATGREHAVAHLVENQGEERLQQQEWPPGAVRPGHGDRDLVPVGVGGDGNCLFRAMAVALCASEAEHPRVRREVIDYVRKHWHDDLAVFALDARGQPFASLERYVAARASSGSFCGALEVLAAARLYRVRFVIHGPRDTIPFEPQDADDADDADDDGEEERPIPTVHLRFSGWQSAGHYDLLVPPDRAVLLGAARAPRAERTKPAEAKKGGRTKRGRRGSRTSRTGDLHLLGDEAEVRQNQQPIGYASRRSRERLHEQDDEIDRPAKRMTTSAAMTFSMTHSLGAPKEIVTQTAPRTRVSDHDEAQQNVREGTESTTTTMTTTSSEAFRVRGVDYHVHGVVPDVVPDVDAHDDEEASRGEQGISDQRESPRDRQPGPPR